MIESDEKNTLKPFNEVWTNIPDIEPFDEPFEIREWVLKTIEEAEELIKRKKIEETKSKEYLEELRKQTFEMISEFYSSLWEMITKPTDSPYEIENARNWAKEIIKKVEENS